MIEWVEKPNGFSEQVNIILGFMVFEFLSCKPTLSLQKPAISTGLVWSFLGKGGKGPSSTSELTHYGAGTVSRELEMIQKSDSE